MFVHDLYLSHPNHCQVTLLYIIILQLVLGVYTFVEWKVRMFVHMQFITVPAHVPYTCSCSMW